MKNSSIQWNLLSILATLCTLWVWKAHTHRDTSDTIVNDTGGSENHSVGSDTALLSESLKNIVRSGITNQDNIDKKAISEELRNIVRSGILDLGILGLWSKDPIVTANTSPMPVFRPASVRQVNWPCKHQSEPCHLKLFNVYVQCV